MEFTPLHFILHVSGMECAKTAGFLHILYPLPLHIDPTLTAQGGITTPLSTTFLARLTRQSRPLWLQTLQFSSVVRFTMIKSPASQPSSLTAYQHHSLTASQPSSLTALNLASLTAFQSHRLPASQLCNLPISQPSSLTVT